MGSISFDKNILYILTILEIIEKLKIYSANDDNADNFFHTQNRMPFHASCHLLLAIGEESKKISEALKDDFSFIQWERIAAIRNRIAHDYRGIDPEIVFAIIKNELDILKEAMIRMLHLQNLSGEKLKELLQSDYYEHIGYLLSENQ